VADRAAIRKATGERIEYAGGGVVRLAGVEVKDHPRSDALQQLFMDLRVVVVRPGKPLWSGFKPGDKARLSLGGVLHDPATGERRWHTMGGPIPADEV
jgi:hypothetical protein